MQATAPADQGSSASFFPVHIDSVETDVLEMDLFIRYGTAEPTLYRGRGIDFTWEDRERLIEQGIEFLYLPMSQHETYCRALTRRLETSFKSPDLSKAERGRVVRASCVRMVEDVMLFPGNSGALGAVAEVGRLFARLAREDEDNFSYVLDMSEHDYYTITHMVNVGVGCGLLMKQLRPDDEKLISLAIQGGLLHDLGKRGVPPEVLNKEGKLTEEEWDQIRRHPMLGYQELMQHKGVPAVVLEMTRDHHERLDGKGYPHGISGEALGFAARVCGVVDVYDAITAARPYRGPIPPADALRLMSEGAGTQFDDEIFKSWRGLVERLLIEDPSRAPVEGGAVRRTLGSLMQVPSTGAKAFGSVGSIVRAASSAELPERRDSAVGGDRRLHPRRSCDLLVLATFERQMKESGVKPGQPFEARVRDLSRGGVQIQTPWPLSLNDLLTLEFRSGDGSVKRRVRVVRVRRDGRGHWSAGACFIAEEGQIRKSA